MATIEERVARLEGASSTVEPRLGKIEQSIVNLSGRIDHLEVHLGSRIDHLDQKIDGLDKTLSGRIDALDRKFDHKFDRVTYLLIAVLLGVVAQFLVGL